MSLFDSASLVVTPNGVKEGKLYSIKPSDGSGDLSVTRATTATRVNSEGLIEQVPYNLLQYSNTFTNGIWTNLNQSLTANSVANPINGNIDAYTITLNSGTSAKVVLQSNFQNGTYTQSVYVKANTHNFIQLLVGNDPNPYCNFDIVNGTYSAYGCTAIIDNVGNGWYRCQITYNTSIGDSACYLWASDSLTSARASNSASTGIYYAYGFQLVQGSSAKEYFPTTNRLNIPRLDYTNGSCPSILVEPQRTNLALSSEDFTNATYWNSTGDMVTTANQAISPSGLQNADLFFDSGSRNKFVSSPVSSYLTFSCYFKRVDVTNVLITASDFYSGDVSATFNLVALTSSSAISGDWSNNSTKIESVGNGWYRCSLTALRGAGGSGVQYRIECAEVEKSFYAWGYQLEAGSYATSYIPTTSASVTRNADVISKTGISSLIGQTEGTIFCDVINSKTILDTIIISLSDGTFSNYLQLSTNSSTGNLQSVIFTGGGATALGTITTNVNQRYKIAIAYKLNDYALYINGVQIGTLNSKAAPTLLTRLDISGLSWAAEGYIYSNPYNSAALFKTRLTNAELAQLTTI
jgi:hypothetical protein